MLDDSDKNTTIANVLKWPAFPTIRTASDVAVDKKGHEPQAFNWRPNNQGRQMQQTTIPARTGT